MYHIVKVGGYLVVVAQWQSAGGSSQGPWVKFPATIGFSFLCLTSQVSTWVVGRVDATANSTSLKMKQQFYITEPYFSYTYGCCLLCNMSLPKSTVALWYYTSFVPRACVPPGEKWSGKQSRIAWAY